MTNENALKSSYDSTVKETNLLTAVDDINVIDQLSRIIGNGYFQKKTDFKKDILITIPAKNEEATIVRTLQSLKKQFYLSGACFDYDLFEVLVLCNNCTDDTLRKCNDFKHKNPDFPLHVLVSNSKIICNVGVARRILMNIACSRVSKNGFIVTTDADTVADKFFLSGIYQYLDSDYGLICGRILVDDAHLDTKAKKYLHASRDYLDLMCKLESTLYPDFSDPWPKHAHNSGPNLSIRKYAYQKIGGIPPLGFLEDIALYELVLLHGFKVKHCMQTVVTTSTRTTPRVPGGFGNQLREWAEFDERRDSYNVESFEKLFQKFSAYELIKQLYLTENLNLVKEICDKLKMPHDQLKELYKTHDRYQSLVRFLESALPNSSKWNVTYPDIDIFMAIAQLETYFITVEHEKV
tara:strand:- start:25225 stop:26448 length:1224 start_codon:yes stop_codon:yes gene_type:complete